MILLQCPLCKGWMTAEVNDVRKARTVLCPQCHRESSVYDVLNRRNVVGATDTLFPEIRQFVENIGDVNVDERIRILCERHSLAPTIAVYMANCLLDCHPSEDHPWLFAEYETPDAVSLSDYLAKLEIEIQNHRREPQISISAHMASAQEVTSCRKIKELEQRIQTIQTELDCSRSQIDNLNEQLDNQQRMIRNLKDKIAFLRGERRESEF